MTRKILHDWIEEWEALIAGREVRVEVVDGGEELGEGEGGGRGLTEVLLV